MDRFYRLAYKLVDASFKHFNKSQKKNMADLMTAFLSNRSFALWDIATGLSGDSSVRHKHKRLSYFLDSLTLDTNFWKCFCLAVFSLPGFRFKSRRPVTLALDATTLKEDFWVLAVSVSYKGRSIPILVKGWKDVNAKYDYWGRVKGVLKELKEILPEGYEYELLADRGFQGEEMFDVCNELGIDFIVRINDSYRMKLPNGEEFIQLSLFKDGYYPRVTLGKKAPTPGLNVCINGTMTETGEEAKWYLVSNKESSHQEMVERYTHRFWIEESFKDLKSKLHWERYTKKIPEKDRLMKCISISCLSYALQTALGGQLNMGEKERMTTSVFNKFRQAIRRGTEELEGIIMNFINIIKVYVNRTEKRFC